jgi:photosystem II stability/assembly factor-like uncharacterized protein
MTSFAVMDTNLFAARSYGGFFRTDNNGISWITEDAGLPSQPIVDLAVLDSLIFAGTNGAGIYRSGNLGANWIPVNTGLSADTITTLAVIDTVLFAGTLEGGVFRSSDNGDNWAPVTSGLSGDTITAFAAKGTQLFAGTSSGKVFRSGDNGDSWIPISTVPAKEQVTCFTFIDNYMFAGTFSGAYRSTDNGEHWTAANDGMIYRQVRALHTLGGDLFAGTIGGIYRSSNQGESWTDVNSGMKNACIRALAMDGNKLYASTRTGIYLSGDGGENWEPFLENAPIFSLAFTTEYFYAGTYGHLFITPRESTNWNSIPYPDSTHRIYSLAARENTVFVGTEGAGLFRTKNYGPTFWESLQVGFISTPVNCLVFDGATIYAGTGMGVYSSTDEGMHWTTLNEGLTDLNIMALTFKGTDLFAGTGSKGVFCSTDHGANWTPANKGMEDQMVMSFAVKGENLFAGTWNGGVLHSTDNGANWITISHSSIFDTWVKIPQVIHGLVVDNTYLYAGERRTGVWRRPLDELITPVDSFSIDSIAPELMVANDPLYQPELIEVTSTEDGIIYLVPEYTYKDLTNIRGVCLDSVVALAYSAVDIPLSSFENGIYWLYGRDSSSNISDFEAFTIIGVGISDVSTDQIRLYPNPTNDKITIQAMAPGDYLMEIFSMNGQIILSRDFSGPTHQIDLSSLQKGFYFITVRSRDHVRTEKIIKQ